MNRPFLLFSLIFLACSFSVQAQDIRKPPTVVGPSPEAASLGQYGSWPVSLYTGIPQISAPLYTIDFRGYKLPVSLSYHASGIKIEDVASWVGTGWALNAGGVITRTAMGLEDDDPVGFYNTPYLNANLPDTFDVVGNDATYKLFTDVMGNLYDTEPDMFNFNFGDVSGQFYFDRTGTVRTIPASNILVKHHPMNAYLPQSEKYWEIVDEKGVTYILGQENAIETTTMQDDDQMFRKVAKTAWYLNKIILANRQDSITFQYAEKSERYDTKPSQTYRVPGPAATAVPVGAEDLMANGYGYSRQTGEGPYSAFTINQGKVQLSAIAWKYGKINFYAKTSRKDIAGLLLDSIYVLSTGNVLQKNFRFKYNNNVNRPFLTSIVEKSRIGKDTLERYKFEYYEGLPSRFSNSQDEWGYYNGSSNTSLVPYDPFVTEFATNYFPTPNANRSVSKDHMMAGTLKRIYYPTKGFTEFDFETNSYFKIADQGTGPVRDGYYADKTISMNVNQLYPQRKDTQLISIDNETNGAELSSLKIQIRNYYRGAGPENTYLPKIKIESLNGSQPSVIYEINAFDNWEQAKTRIKYNNGREDLDFDLQLFLGDGTFRVITELACTSVSGNCPTLEYLTTMNASYTFSTFIPVIPGSTPGSVYNLAGGLRVRRIKNYDLDEKLVSAKYYEYTTANAGSGENIVSSGTLLVKPSFFSYSFQPLMCGMMPNGACYANSLPVGTFTSSSLAILGLTQGGYVGYSEVKERDDSDGGNGETIYKYSTAENRYEPTKISTFYSRDHFRWPVYLPNVDSSYKRGLLLEKTVNAKVGTTYKIVFREKYSYLFNDYEGAPNYYGSRYVRIRRMSDSLGPCCSGLPPANVRRAWRDKEFIYSYYTIKSPWVQMVSKSVEQDSVETITKYEYKNLRSMQPTKEVVYTSKGDSIVKTYKYPNDIVNAGQDYNGSLGKMLNRNIVTPVIEEETAKNASISKLRTSYRDWFANSNLLLPDSVLVKYNNTASYQDVLVYNAYDRYGNILSYSSNRTPFNFLWGYGREYPVGKIMGSNYNKVAGMTDSSLLDNPSDEQQIHSELNKIRVGMTNEKVLVQSYAYLPLLGLSSETTVQGQKIYYEYDGFGRLVVVRDQNKRILKMYDYSYGATGELTYTNDQYEGTYVKGTCGDGYFGEAVRYVVPKGTYFSIISPADANLKASNDVQQNGQLYADMNGKCYKLYYNQADSVTLPRICTNGGEGAAVTYLVPAKKYSSVISQKSADSLATDDITKNAQAYANQNGKCYFYNTQQSQTFTPVCSGNYQNIGSVTYTVPARKDSSVISLVDANQKALNDIALNGQTYANSVGCICVGEGYMVVNGTCELGRKVQIESHMVGDKWACTYYYQFSNGTRSANYSGLGDQQCAPPND